MRRQTAENPAEKKHPFLEAFLFTENGKPKSSLGIYTFCLSFVFLLVYVLCYEGAIRLLTGPLSPDAAFWTAKIVSGVVVIVFNYVASKLVIFKKKEEKA